ncbi:Protein_disulfide isomerase PDI2 [Hexamita inflata]|uniref:Protein disulfide isomerase PDI2 n=1 Tax=Hexamita inflata TaxID=28002 RepID=A0AA86NNG1_9EUKA|nr:Protein disulfide isomerase PDI2 [Hexamita inflata]
MFALVFAEVLKLTDATFEEHLKANPYTLLKMFAPWCGHCKELAPKWEKLAGISDIPVAEVDCTTDSKTCGKYGVRGYPSVKMVGPNIAYDYDGERDTEPIKEWSQKMRQPMFTPLKDKSEVKATKTNYFLVYGDASATEKFEGLLTAYKGKQEFFFIVSNEEKIVAVRQGVELETKDFNKGPLAMFIEINKVDFFPNLKQNYEGMVNRAGKQLILVCLSSMQHEQKVALEELDKAFSLGEESAQFLQKYTLAYVDADDMGTFVEQFEQPVGEVPFFVFYQGKNEKSKKYSKVMIDDSNIVDQLKKSIDDWTAGKLKKSWIEDEKDKKERKEKEEKKEKEEPKKENKQESKQKLDKELLQELKNYIDEKVKNLATKKDVEEALKKFM